MIHIVCQRLDKDRVLPRLARSLSKATGWSIGEHPIPGAKLNYFFPYLELQKREWEDTLSAAWFTHKDTAEPRKEAVWNSVAKRVDLRTLTAGIYKKDLEQFGDVRMVRPMVELDRFVPVKKERKQTIGVSGWLYRDNRKGEDLITRLAKEVDGDWKASGRGWSIPTKMYTWKDLPKFFQSLDLFVCASRIEGVPMPPLEALSCGIPVVIPRGVGLLDDLPDIPGITRFVKGNYKSLRGAVEQSLNTDYDTDELRNSVLQYNEKNWANDHKLAFDNLVYGTQPYTQPGKGKQGMYCVAFGEPSRKCAVRLVKSFKRFMPDTPIMFVGEKALNVGEDVFVKQKDKDIGGRLGKLSVDRLAPKDWEYVLYLDADTELMEPVDFIFETLRKGWEFVICKDMHDRHWLAKMRRGDNEDECNYTEDLVGTDRAMQYNGGVFAYRRTSGTKRFFELWNIEYQKWLGRDQGALIRALHTQPLRMFVLGNQWNASDRYELPPGPIAIMHHNVQARRWSRGIQGRIDSKDAWNAVEEWERVNTELGNRSPFSSGGR